MMKLMEERSQTVMSELAKKQQKISIQKISIDNGQVNYLSSGEVPGYLLNQFSMDEFEGNFRVATTTSYYDYKSQKQVTGNNIYVLDQNMNPLGKIEDLAPG